MLPPETTVDPASLTDHERDRSGILRMPDSPVDVITALDNSEKLRGILGDPVVDAVVAVRRLVQERYSDLSPEQLADKFRMAWSL